ncbi:molybdenum cofactor biosynthesis protein MoaE [Terrilactibacillus sp. BCM23-1]|uniref:Molybdopterin synthase catalytic subunit n=1 Tax=Terrilactibacillus tamarindi TaxID=2599694 RepID=A0A6N8CNY9_9BACI|nr:molybdenum cofactor biosynthesis protein MoaE [Terrilactibacillus tamarindi]MTT31832.1 molybdenum cofactor biosynthesis protein MoaE [Terrilactibacillus tamarindi]
MFDIVSRPIDIGKVINQVEHRNAGAIVTFIGTVREMTQDKKTLYLEYEAYEPMAREMLSNIGKEIKKQWPGTVTAIVHRIGHLDIGDIAVVIAVSSPHRSDAYEANRYAIERIKTLVPIWKKEHWEDGDLWIGNQEGTVSYTENQSKV